MPGPRFRAARPVGLTALSAGSWSGLQAAGSDIADGGGGVDGQGGGQPARLAVGGSVTYQSGFRCVGAQFVTVGESTEPPAYTTWTYQRDTYTWSGAKLVPVSSRTGQVTSNPPGTPPAAYTGVSCGQLPQLAPPYK